MTFKIKVVKSLTLKTLIPDIAREFNRRRFRAEVVNITRQEIMSGQSPVLKKRFRQYSLAYANSVKSGKRKPVTMTDKGKMLKKLGTESSRSKFNYRLVFRRSIIAFYHNSVGAGPKGKGNKRGKVIRRLLPSRPGERFNPRITKLIQKIANFSVKAATKKQNK